MQKAATQYEGEVDTTTEQQADELWLDWGCNSSPNLDVTRGSATSIDLRDEQSDQQEGWARSQSPWQLDWASDEGAGLGSDLQTKTLERVTTLPPLFLDESTLTTSGPQELKVQEQVAETATVPSVSAASATAAQKQATKAHIGSLLILVGCIFLVLALFLFVSGRRQQASNLTLTRSIHNEAVQFDAAQSGLSQTGDGLTAAKNKLAELSKRQDDLNRAANDAIGTFNAAANSYGSAHDKAVSDIQTKGQASLDALQAQLNQTPKQSTTPATAPTR